MKITIEVELNMTELGKDIYGTSMQGRIEANYSQICKVFGAPNRDTAESPDHKIDVEWQGYIDGEPFTIYNYKDGPAYLKEAGTPIVKITDWHIGAKHARTAQKVIAVFYAEGGNGIGEVEE